MEEIDTGGHACHTDFAVLAAVQVGERDLSHHLSIYGEQTHGGV